ncbi:uncharacterized protein [Drosophila bipectinata]|uniref:uncharacterized protein n=1 Tax=Drosophila bipectinata TaxID=42026 RepID=UPI0038B3B4F4
MVALQNAKLQQLDARNENDLRILVDYENDPQSFLKIPIVRIETQAELIQETISIDDDTPFEETMDTVEVQDDEDTDADNGQTSEELQVLNALNEEIRPDPGPQENN